MSIFLFTVSHLLTMVWHSCAESVHLGSLFYDCTLSAHECQTIGVLTGIRALKVCIWDFFPLFLQ